MKKREPIIGDGVVGVRLTKGLVAWIDAADWSLVSMHSWRALQRGHTWYAITSIGRQTVTMHGLLMNPPKGFEVDHGDGVGLHNYRWNLRNVTHAENMRNSRRCVGGNCLQKLLEHRMSTPEERDARWAEIEKQIQELHAGKVVSGDPAEIEQELFAEQDALEFEAGEEYFRERDGSDGGS